MSFREILSQDEAQEVELQIFLEEVFWCFRFVFEPRRGRVLGLLF